MKAKAFILVCVGFIILLFGCENPAAPNFKSSHSVQAPLVLNKTYTFLGGPGSLIDTTSSNFDSLFSVSGNGLVNLSKSTDFVFGSLDKALPVITINSINSHSEIGAVTLDNFSSQGSSGNIGSAGFQAITGQSSSSYPSGTNLIAGSTSSPSNISLTTDYFQSAVTDQSGNLVLTLQNNLGFNLSQLKVTLNSGSTAVGTGTVSSFNDNTTTQLTISIPAGTTLKSLNIDVSASWNSQTMSRNPQDLVVQNITGSSLTASQATAVISSQKFTSAGTSVIDSTDFEFRKSTHYVELSSGNIHVYNVVNRIALGVDTLSISFPGIRKSPFGASDSLVIQFEGSSKIPASSVNAVEKTVDLTGYRIYSNKNSLDYNISGVTENTQNGSGSSMTTVNKTDSLTTTIDLNNLNINKAFGNIRPKSVLLNTDDPSNGTGILDLSDSNEVKTVQMSGMTNLSNQIRGIKFIKPLMDLNSTTNLGTNTTVYAGIRGVSANGNAVYLHGINGSANQVATGEAPSGLDFDGQALKPDQLIKFLVKKAPGGVTINDGVEFDTSNTNVKAFFDNLPTDIRFIGIARINQSGTQEGTIIDPVQLDQSISINIPLHFLTKSDTYADTTGANLGSLPGDGNTKEQLTSAKLTVDYNNALPLRIQVGFTMLNNNSKVITSVPAPGAAAQFAKAAAVDPTTEFVSQASQGEMVYTLTASQLKVLSKTRQMIIGLLFNTTDKKAIKIRAKDSITLSIKLSVVIQSTVN